MALYPDLRITKWLVSEEDLIKSEDFTTFLLKDSPVYTKGRKNYSEYLDPDTGDLVAKKTYTDLYDGTSSLIGINIVIEWFNSDGIVGLSKQFVKPVNFAEAAYIIRNRRYKSIDYLKAAGKGTPVEQYQLAIFSHYEAEIREWYEMGGSVLTDAINNEADATILTYLAIETQPDWTVKDGILYQIDHPWDV